MFAVHFYENNIIVLTQALRNIPVVDEELRIKGRKCKVLDVSYNDNNHVHVQIEFEKIVEKSKAALELGKKKKR
ncbi:hypothetical protein [uncultured Psychrobacillus sp.]|uniref:hypothetical protein n=1 Tax=uncultured Psychrobacillus sp. TaxID=1551585 RepID=UPI00262AA96B|nr:hypothetical protein [uncultured Psychrobacillus sp.]